MAVQVLKNNCTSGELSPKLHRRSELVQYQNGLDTCYNAVVSPYGGVYRRFGTKYISSAKHSDKLSIRRKFEFSIDQSYVLEIGEYYIRFHIDGALIVVEYSAWATLTDYLPGDLATESGSYYRCIVEHTSGTFSTDLSNGYWVETEGENDIAYEVPSTYEEDELRSLRFEQSADVLYIFHKDHHPAKLTRYSHTSWTLSDCDFTGGPFIDNDLSGITLTPSAVTGSITVAASSPVFDELHIGSLWKLSSGRAVAEVTAAITSNTSSDAVETGNETVELQISGTWSAKVVVERSFNKGTDWYPYQTIGSNCVKKYSDTRDLSYRVTISNYVSGTVNVRLSALDSDGTGQGTIRITGFTDGSNVSADVVDELRSTDATNIWAEAAWSKYRGYPRAGKIYEGRLVLACTNYDSKGVWGSSSLEYENFKLGTNDDDAFYFSLDAKGGINELKWMESWKHLALGTVGGEIRLTSNNGISPSNPPDKKQDSSYGSTDIQGFVAVRSIIFVDRCRRILREYAYDYNTDAFDSPSISVLSEHILNEGGGIIDVAYQQKQDSIIWCVLSDGTLGAITYLPGQQVSGWHKHALGGVAEIESICVIPGNYGHDEVWFAVKRMINGSEVRYTELMYEDESLWEYYLSTVWKPYTVYPVGALVTDPGNPNHYFRCFARHRSGDEFPGEGGYWVSSDPDDYYEWSCCDNEEYDFSFDDDSTSDTIVAGNSIEIYVTGGCGPFTYSTSSNGYDIEGQSSYQTNDRNVTLNCVSGDCGVDFDVTAMITITDGCGTEISATIRNTGGSWVAYGSGVAYYTEGSPYYCDNADCVTSSSNEIIEGEYKWEISEVLSKRVCKQPYTVWTQYSGTWIDPPCGSPMDCLSVLNISTSGCPSPDTCSEGTSCIPHYVNPSVIHRWEC